MLIQAGRVYEAFPTPPALERSLTAVRACVRDQLVQECEGLTALLTTVRPLTRVRHQVALVVVPARENLAAELACELALRSFQRLISFFSVA